MRNLLILFCAIELFILKLSHAQGYKHHGHHHEVPDLSKGFGKIYDREYVC